MNDQGKIYTCVGMLSLANEIWVAKSIRFICVVAVLLIFMAEYFWVYLNVEVEFLWLKNNTVSIHFEYKYFVQVKALSGTD